MNYTLSSIPTNKLSKKHIIQICKLKDQHWKFGKELQIKWFNNNIKKDDIHNLFFKESKLIGYTLLRKRTYKINNQIKKHKYLLFDTLIIDKNFKKKKLSELLMIFNNTIINQTGLFSFLVCKKNMINFYKKHHWIKLNKSKINILDHSFSSIGMAIYVKNKNKIFNFYINE